MYLLAQAGIMNSTVITTHCVNPIISVIMPVYNGALFLSEAIESILRQTYTNFEFIIVDDGSTDSSRSIMLDYAKKDQRIRLILLNHSGVTGAMNEGVRLACGEWIARMDHDDVSLPDRLAVQLEWAIQNNLDVCGAQAETFGPKGEKIWWFPETHEAICKELFFRCSILYPTAIIRTDVFRNNLHINDCFFDDYELFSRLAPKYHLGNAAPVLLRYRRHETQTSKIRQKDFNKDFQKYHFRYFYKTFPNTPLADYIAFARFAGGGHMTNLWELERAGQWLVQLSDVSDEMVRQRMGQRWQKTCKRSAALGKEVDIIFQRYMDMIRKDKDVTITAK
jgi:glycosyltransferase involved in cell wall biosynthesis